MKKLLLCIVVISMCLSFAGCDEIKNPFGPSNSDETGDKYVTGDSDDTEEEIEYKYSDLEEILENKDFYESVEAVLAYRSAPADSDLSPSKNMMGVHRDLIQFLENKDFNNAIRYIASLSAQAGRPDFLNGFTNVKLVSYEDSVKNVLIDGGGIFTCDGQELFWIEDKENDNIAIFYEDEVKYRGSVKDGAFNLTDTNGDIVAVLAPIDPSVLEKFVGEWISLSGDTGNTVNIEKNEKGIKIHTRFFSGYMEITKDHDGEVVLAHPDHSITISKRNEKYFLTLFENGEKQYYYYSSQGLDEAWPEVSYVRALIALEELKNDNRYYHFEWIEGALTRQQALAHCYELLGKCGSVADVSELVGRFTVIKNTLVSISCEIDVEHDKNGKLIVGYDPATFMRYFGWRFNFVDSLPYKFSYDSKGRVSEILIEVPVTPQTSQDWYIRFTYKSNGQLDKITAKDDTKTIEFHTFYETDGNLLEITGSFIDSNGEEQMLWRNFSYDPESGRVSGEAAWFCDVNGTFYSSVTSYEYDNKGRVATETVFYDFEEGTGNDVTDTFTYSYDENGNMTKMKCAGSDGTSREISYAYGNYYFLSSK